MTRMRFFFILLLSASAAQAAAAATARVNHFQNLHFRNLGPAVAGGRVTAVVGIPGNPHIYYVGTAAGGIFKSADGGVSWLPIFQHAPVSSIGALAVAPSNPNLVWVGTGEGNLRNDVITGRGVYFSPDGGRTWRDAGLDDAGQISSVVINPTNPDIVLVGVVGDAWGPSAERGVFRTTDGGRTWRKVLYVNDTTGASDMAMDPQNPLIVYAGMSQIRRYPWEMVSGGAGSGIYKSLDGGVTWTKLTDGLPGPPLGRIGLTIAPSNPLHVYALVESKAGLLWESRDGGNHWDKISDNWLIDARPWYFGRLAVSPANENKIYFMSYDLLASEDGGRTVHNIGRGIHPDHHAMWIDPRDPTRIIEGNDGGVYLSSNGGDTWRFAADLPIEQFYSVALDDRTPYTICGGLQDNSAWCGLSETLAPGNIPNQEWWVVMGGDGQYAVPAPGTNLVYADSQNGVIEVRDHTSGRGGRIRPYLLSVEELKQSDLRYRFNWTSPIAVAPGNGKQVYLGGNVLFRSDDAGTSWRVISPDLTRNDKSKQVLSGGPIENDLSGAETYDTILSIAISRQNSKVIWVGTDDGLVQRTSDGGQHWSNVTPKGVPGWGRIEQIDVSPFDPNTAYVAIDYHETDNNHPYVLKTHDGGASWQNISTGLPENAPAHVVREDPDRRGLLVVGTDTGLFYSTNDGAAWEALGAGLPTVPVYDLKFQPAMHDLVVATHGRGIFVLDDMSPIEDVTAQILASNVFLFRPQRAFRTSVFNRYGRIQTHGAQWSAANRPLGALIDYYLKQASPGGVQITIADSRGEVVRRLAGPGKAGVNRVAWNLTYDAVPRPEFMSQSVGSWIPARAGGPPVVPGTYTIAIRAGVQTDTKTIDVDPDPRFPVDKEAMQAQTAAGLEVRVITAHLVDLLDQSNLIEEQLGFIEKMTSHSEPKRSALLPQARALNRQLDAWSAPLFNPAIQTDPKYYLHYLGRVYDRLQRLMNDINANYATAPSAADEKEISTLRQRTDEAQRGFVRIVRSDVAAFNRIARAAGTMTIHVSVAMSGTAGKDAPLHP
ncbi:MAG: WD40/YVTN/BNR-like repeat-containing protein [Candidatus Acidiferrales bacterium]